MSKVSPLFEIPDDELHFSFARSSGPGGQNVNKTNSKAVLSWNIQESGFVPLDVKARFYTAFGNRISELGAIVIASDETRDRMQNQSRCVEKLSEMLTEVWIPPKPRRATKPTKSSQRRRVDNKKQRGETKSGRGKVRSWD